MEFFFKKEKLYTLLENSVNKTLGEVDIKNVFKKTIDKPKITGIAGDVIEQSVLGLPANSSQKPDLNIDGILTELKTTGIRLSKTDKKLFEAKEPLTVTAVSPHQIVNEIFETSKFWHKLEHLLLVYYHYSSNTTVIASDYANFYIKSYEFHEFSKEDRDRLENDWTIVRDFIKQLQSNYEIPENEYPRISSELRSQLVYIDTAPKWPNNPRFRLKRHVITSIVQNHFGNSLEHIPGIYNSYKEIDDKCCELVNKYLGMSVKDLISKLNIDLKESSKNSANGEKNLLIPKSISEQIVVRMFGGKSKKISKIDIFEKFGLIGKSIILTPDGKRTEDMKLFSIDFDEWRDKECEFEESMVYDYFYNHQFLCIIFEEPFKNSPLANNVFKGFKRLSFSDDFIQTDVRKIWHDIRILLNENKLKETVKTDKFNNTKINKTGVPQTTINFPKSKNGNIFVRGTGADSRFKKLNVNGINMYHQSIWLKGLFVVEELNKIK